MISVRQIIHLIDEYLEKTMIVSLISILVICLTYSAFIRYFVSIPFFTELTHKAEEIAMFSFVWLLYWGACLATKENAHFRINAHFTYLSKRWKRWQYLPGDVIWLAFNVFIVWQGWILTKSAITNPEYSLSLEIHMAIIYSAIPITFGVSILRILQNYIRRNGSSSDDQLSVIEDH